MPNMQVLLLCLVSLAFSGHMSCEKVKKYIPTWDSIDSRPLPAWYDDAKFGIFLHWGVYSVPSLTDEWFWKLWTEGVKEIKDYMNTYYPPTFTYQDFAAQFKAEFYDPYRWTEIFKAAGAKYVVLTTKHHEGFCMWPSKHSWNWNAMDVGPKRNLVGDFVTAVRNNTDLRLGLYHSLYEWFNPLWLQDVANNYSTREFPLTKALPELYELVNWFEPDLIWSDGPRGPDDYWRATEFLAWLYNDSPVKDSIVVNDRWFWDTRVKKNPPISTCKHGGFYTCGDRYNPGHLIKHKWEDATSVDKRSWGFRRNMKLSEVETTQDLIHGLVEAVSCGGNYLLDVGPTESGVISVIFEERLRDIGSWLKVNGEAIYGTRPWVYQNDTVTPYVWYTAKKSETGWAVYAAALDWPDNQKLTLGGIIPSKDTKVKMLGYDGNLTWKPRSEGGINIVLPILQFKDIPCQWAWVFKLDHLVF